jgi:hypothetical protein
VPLCHLKPVFKKCIKNFGEKLANKKKAFKLMVHLQADFDMPGIQK